VGPTAGVVQGWEEGDAENTFRAVQSPSALPEHPILGGGEVDYPHHPEAGDMTQIMTSYRQTNVGPPRSLNGSWPSPTGQNHEN
jgi:hypothetical protein